MNRSNQQGTALLSSINLNQNKDNNNNKKVQQKDMNNQKVKSLIKIRPRFIFNKYQMKLHTYIFIFGVFLLVIKYIEYCYTTVQKSFQLNNDNDPTNDIQNMDYMKQSWLTQISYPYNFLRDGHDPQWQSFRSNLLLTLAMIFFWYIVQFPRKYSWIFGLIITIVCFRADSIIYFSILFIWYFYTRIFYKMKYFVISCWAIAIGLLYYNEQTDHLKFISDFIQSYIPQQLQFFKNSNRLFHFAQLLNMNLIKLLSFSIDNHRGDESQDLKKHLLKCKECQSQSLKNQKESQKKQIQIDYCYKGRDLYPFTPNINQNFSLKNFMNYILFSPTFFAGPPISYKNFLSFDSLPTTKKNKKNMTKALSNLVFLLISFEIYLHFMPTMKPTINESLVIIQLASLLDLMFLWYKFIVIWRTYRFWALIAGVDVIDNLQRCMMNNYGFQGFWRMWHRGFNHWLIRYLYIPCGGNKNYFSVILTIAFVAFWHDHSIYIVLWALIIVLFIIPQMVVKRFFRNWRGSPKLYKNQWFKYLCALIAGVYIYALCLANIYGFGIGKDHTNVLFSKMLDNSLTLILSIFYVAQAALIMFYLRECEGGQKSF